MEFIYNIHKNYISVIQIIIKAFNNLYFLDTQIFFEFIAQFVDITNFTHNFFILKNHNNPIKFM